MPDERFEALELPSTRVPPIIITDNLELIRKVRARQKIAAPFISTWPTSMKESIASRIDCRCG